MKKLSRKNRQWFFIRSRGEEKKKKKKVVERKRRKRMFGGFEKVVAPKSFSLFDEKCRQKTVRFVEKIRGLVEKGERGIWLDFSNTNKFVSDGAIFLYAELYRIHTCVDVDLRCTLPRNDKASQVIKKIGLAKILKCKVNSSRKSVMYDDVVNWRSAYGEAVVAAKYDDILGPYEGRIAEALSKGLFTGVSEAMTNAHQHAYIDAGKPRDKISQVEDYRPWWMFSQEKDGKLMVVFCDLGIGIPVSLPILHKGIVKRWMGKTVKDSEAIEDAVKLDKTRTSLPYRGKGLPQIVKTVNETSGGRVAIYSNKGCYALNNGVPDHKDFSTSIKGTIIMWSVPIPAN